MARKTELPRGLRAVVTGAGGGLGQALALELCRRGASVIVSDIDDDGAALTVDRIKAIGGTAHAVRCDVGNLEQMQQLGERAVELLGGVDLVANNAGVAVSGRIGEVAMEDWRFIMDINLWGVIYGCRVFAPQMRKQGRGYVLNVASAAGLLCAPEMAPYNVTKAGVVALSETMHAELRDAGVHVSVLCPTFFKTNIMNSGRGTTTDEDKEFVAHLMERSKIQAPEVASLALDAVARNDLYCVPMRDGRMAWLAKRMNPRRFYDLVGAVSKRRRERRAD